MKRFQTAFLLGAILISHRLLSADLPAGYVVGWGNNLAGQATGIAVGSYSTGTVTITGQVLSNAVAVSAGKNHSLALKSDGTVVGWGDNDSGRAIGVEAEAPYLTNGLVMIDGQMLSNVVAVSAYQYSLALRRDGTPVVWGRDGSGKPIVIPADFNNALSIATGEEYSLALKKDGTITSATGLGETVAPIELSNVVAIATATRNSIGRDLALKKDGTVVQWNGRIGLMDVPPRLSNVVAVAVGGDQNLVLKKNGTVVAWQLGVSGEANVPPGLSNVVAIAVSKNDWPYSASSMALKNDGTVVMWESKPYQLIDVPTGLSNVVAIAAGDGYYLAITTNRAVADKFRH
jgi:alpha-tubulin suppressor-like RCC1 family protein